jgi:hypothetical protein
MDEDRFEEEMKQHLRWQMSCPECGSKMQPSGGCALCLCCGYSKCG